MPSVYIQLLLVNMLLAVLTSTVVLGAPILPAVVGAVGAGALLFAGHRARNHRAAPSGTMHAPDPNHTRGQIEDLARSSATMSGPSSTQRGSR
jgi:hypothetical protein